MEFAMKQLFQCETCFSIEEFIGHQLIVPDTNVFLSWTWSLIPRTNCLDVPITFQ